MKNGIWISVTAAVLGTLAHAAEPNSQADTTTLQPTVSEQITKYLITTNTDGSATMLSSDGTSEQLPIEMLEALKTFNTANTPTFNHSNPCATIVRKLGK